MKRTALIIWLIFITFWSTGQDTTSKHGTITLKKKYNEADYWPRIANKMSGEISASELCHPKGIYTIYPMEIISFDMKSSYIPESSEVNSKGHVLTDEMCKIVTVLPNNAIIHLENIMAKDDQGRELRLNSLRFTIHNPPNKNQ